MESPYFWGISFLLFVFFVVRFLLKNKKNTLMDYAILKQSGNEVHLINPKNGRKVVFFQVDNEKLKKFQETIVSEEEERQILGEYLFRVLKKIREG